MDEPQYITDPDEIAFLQAVRKLSPDARGELLPMMRAMVEEAAASELRAAVRRYARAAGISEAAALKTVNRRLGPHAVR